MTDGIDSVLVFISGQASAALAAVSPDGTGLAGRLLEISNCQITLFGDDKCDLL